MATKTSANTKQSEAAAKRPQTWKRGQSGNPAGAPKRELRWKERTAAIGCMTKGVVKKFWKTVGEKLEYLPDGVTLRDAAILSAYADAINNPTSGMIGMLADREEGKPAQAIDLTGVAVTDVLREYGIEDVVAELNNRIREQKP